MVEIRAETDADFVAIDEVNRLAFEGEDEVRIVRGLREGGYAVLSIVAEVEGKVVGHCMFSLMTVGDVAALALGPVAVLPAHQRRGIGNQLVYFGLEFCKNQGHLRVIDLGHAEYYPKFGFRAELTKNIEHPFPPKNFMALELVAGAMQNITGRVQYPPPFGID